MYIDSVNYGNGSSTTTATETSDLYNHDWSLGTATQFTTAYSTSSSAKRVQVTRKMQWK